MFAGGGQVCGVQALRGLVQNTEPQVVGSSVVPPSTCAAADDGTMTSAPPIDSVATRAPTLASTSSTMSSPQANR